MTIEQREALAEAYVACGRLLLAREWSAHARFSFSRAAGLYDDLRQHRRSDDCWYLESLAALRQARGWSRVRLMPVWLFAGFGYRPYRLFYLGWLTVAIFGCAYALLQSQWGWVDSMVISAMNYLTALGYGDVKDSANNIKFLVVLQGFISLALNTTLFALLVRRWFRA